MGEAENAPVKLNFDPKVRLEFAVLPSPQMPDYWHAENSMTLLV
jgi:hypothetical protein